jgi:hypothetical protein
MAMMPPSYTGAAVRCGESGAGSGRCHAVRRWGRVPARPVGGRRPTMAQPWRSWAAPNRGEARDDRWAPATVSGGAGSKRFQPFQKFKQFENVQNFPNFDQSKFDLPELQKFEINYGFEDLEKMNNFLHRNFFRFRRILNKNSEKPLCLEFNIISSWNFEFE